MAKNSHPSVPPCLGDTISVVHWMVLEFLAIHLFLPQVLRPLVATTGQPRPVCHPRPRQVHKFSSCVLACRTPFILLCNLFYCSTMTKHYSSGMSGFNKKAKSCNDSCQPR